MQSQRDMAKYTAMGPGLHRPTKDIPEYNSTHSSEWDSHDENVNARQICSVTCLIPQKGGCVLSSEALGSVFLLTNIYIK